MKIGDAVPDFCLPTTGGDFALAQARGKAVVLYFYPKDDTPGCTLEGHEFSALHDEFVGADAVVLGVSRDGVASHNRFRDKFNYRHDLLSDAGAELCNLFGVLRDKTMYGKPVKGIVRSTFLVGRDGRLAREWRDVKPEGHAAEVLAAVREL